MTEDIYAGSLLSFKGNSYRKLDSIQTNVGRNINGKSIAELVSRVGDELSAEQKYSAVIRYVMMARGKLRQLLSAGVDTEKKIDRPFFSALRPMFILVCLSRL